MDEGHVKKHFLLGDIRIGSASPLSGASIFVWLIVLGFIFSLLTPNFLTGPNLLTICKQSALIGIIAIGMTFVIITGGVDLSVGSLVSFCGSLMGVVWVQTHNIFVAVLAGMLLGTACGAISGLLVGYAKMPPFIATFGMMGVGSGLAFVLSPSTIGGFPRGFDYLGNGLLLGIPFPFVLMVVLAVIAQYFLSRTCYGVRVLALGGNEQAARFAGIDISRYKASAYVLSGLLSALGAVLLCARLRSAYPGVGQGWEMNVIAATVIGGVDLMGGKGSVVGAIAGALLIGEIQNGLNLLGIYPFMQQIATGLLIVVAVLGHQVRGDRILQRLMGRSSP
jgi:ribose transport system permease protein